MVDPKPAKSKDYVVTAFDRDGLESKPSQPVIVEDNFNGQLAIETGNSKLETGYSNTGQSFEYQV